MSSPGFSLTTQQESTDGLDPQPDHQWSASLRDSPSPEPCSSRETSFGHTRSLQLRAASCSHPDLDPGPDPDLDPGLGLDLDLDLVEMISDETERTSDGAKRGEDHRRVTAASVLSSSSRSIL